MKAYQSFFSDSLKKFFPYDSKSLQLDVDQTFGSLQGDISFAKHSANPMDRRLEVSGYFLAFIMVLDRHGVPYEKIRQHCLEIAHAYVKPQNLFQAYVKKLPAKLVGTWISKFIIRSFAKRISNLAHPDGFAVNVITDKEETYGLGYGFDIIECGICKQFRKHNYQRYASILCEVDHVTSSLAGLQLIRSGTIANGAIKCDFRFRKITPNTQ